MSGESRRDTIALKLLQLARPGVAWWPQDHQLAREIVDDLLEITVRLAPKPPELHADDSYTVTGRGQAFSFRAGALTTAGVRNPKDLLGKPVIIDGTRYTVTGVEHWAIVCDGECGHPVGLLVKPAGD